MLKIRKSVCKKHPSGWFHAKGQRKTRSKEPRQALTFQAKDNKKAKAHDKPLLLQNFASLREIC